MPRFVRRNLRPIHSIKKIIDSQGGLVADTQKLITLANSQDNPVLSAANTVNPGCKINSIFLNIQVVGTGAAGVLANAYMIIYKIPGNNIPVSEFPDANATGIDNFKRQIFHTEMVMTGDTGDKIPVTLFKGVLKIPKVFATMRNQDYIGVQLFSPGVAMNYCLQCIYKTYD